jgi:hypothetical protein
MTTPRVSENRARAALSADHPLDLPESALCGRQRPATDPDAGRLKDLKILTITGATVEQVLVCKTDLTACRDGAIQRQMHLDRAAFEGFGLEPPIPRLRLIDDKD